MTEWLRLSHRRVLIAGAGGIGAACAAAFASAGAQVAVADVDESRVHGHQTSVLVDLSTQQGCEHAVTRTVELLGGLDILVHAVGINHRVPVLEITDDDWN